MANGYGSGGGMLPDWLFQPGQFGSPEVPDWLRQPTTGYQTPEAPQGLLPMQPSPNQQPVDVTTTDYAVNSRLPASIRYNNPGAQYPGQSAQAFGSTGTQTIGGGHKIAVFDTPEAGAAAQFDLLNRSYTGMSVADAVRKWSGGNNVPSYLAVLGRAGISPNTVITPEFLRGPGGVQLASAMASHEAGRPYPMTPQQWLSAQARAFGGGETGITPPGATLAGPQQMPGQAPQAPPQIPPAAPPGPGDRLMAGGLGFLNASGPFPAIGNLISGLATGQRSDPQGLADQARQSIHQAVIGAGGTQAQAIAAANSPEAFKIIAPELFSGWKVITTGENPITGKQMMMQGPGGQLRPLSDFIRGGAGGTGAPGGGDVGGSGMLAQGVKQYNPNLTGEDYLGQFSPEVQSAVKSYIKGDVLPSGNPRLQGVAAVAKTIAQKYGQDLGIPVSDALFSERRKYRTELGSNSANTAGGQAKAFSQGIEHADALATTLEKLGNFGGFGIPIIAKGVNYAKQGLSTQQAAIAAEASGIGQTLAGEVGKLFSGSAGGGVHERELTRSRFNTVSSPPELAAALRATLETMEGGLRALESRRDQILGPDSGVELVSKETRAKMDKIRETIARLEGSAPAQETKQAPTVAPISGFKVLKVQ